jgi:predicted nucleotidyltransferase
MQAQEIEAYARLIAERFQPVRIVLFGSHAQGTPDADSDVDLLVLMEFDGPAQEQAYRIRRALPRRFPLDLLVRRPADVARRAAAGDQFLREILTTGRVLHERSGS